MKKINITKKIIALIIILTLCMTALAACGTKESAENGSSESEDAISEETEDTESDDASNTSGETASYESTVTTLAVSGVPDGFTERDFDGSYQNAAVINLSDSGIETSSSGVTANGSTVTITKEGSYLFRGSLSDGQIVIDVSGENDKVQIILDGVDITNTSSAAIYVKNADKVFVTTAAGSTNTVTTSGSFVQTDDNNVDGAIFSKDDIVFNGEGTLNVVSAEGHGIVSKNDLKVTGGTLNVTAAKKGLQGKDMVGIAGGTVTIDAGTDGISSVYAVIYGGDVDINAGDDGLNVKENDENTDPKVVLAGGKLTIVSEDDGIQTSGDVELTGTDLTITAGGGYENAAEHYGDMMFGQMGGWGGMGQGGPQFGGGMSASGEVDYDTDDDEDLSESVRHKGIKAVNVAITDGTITIDAQDDAINTDEEVTINGGKVTITAGDDGIHADYKITINGGALDMEYSWEGLEATIIELNDGDIYIAAQDDGVNAAQKVSGETPLLEINGGNITVDMAQGDTDALDSNGNLYIYGGTVNLNCQSPFDYDMDGAIYGGEVYVYGEQVTEIYNQFMGGGGFGGGGHGGGGFGGGGFGGPGGGGFGG